jgi:hypothetical protein
MFFKQSDSIIFFFFLKNQYFRGKNIIFFKKIFSCNFWVFFTDFLLTYYWFSNLLWNIMCPKGTQEDFLMVLETTDIDSLESQVRKEELPISEVKKIIFLNSKGDEELIFKAKYGGDMLCRLTLLYLIEKERDRRIIAASGKVKKRRGMYM